MDAVAVTGVGAVSALGLGAAALIDGVLEGRTGIGPIRCFDASGYRVRIAAEVHPFPEQTLGPREARRMSRCDRLAVLATTEALADAGLEGIAAGAAPPDRIAVVFGAGAGGMLETEAYFARYLAEGPGTRARVSPLGSQQPNATGDWIAARIGASGPKTTISTACSSSATAIGFAADLILEGEADIAIAGGAEALCQVTFAGFNSLRAVDPAGCRPFDVNRAGMSLGEGAAVLVLESLARARARDARLRSILLGYGISADAHHMTNPPPDGRGAAAALRQALAIAGVEPGEVDLVNAHGTGTRANDIAEANAIASVLGDRARDVPVHSMKSSVGHCLGASGAVEAVGTILSLERGAAPPTYGLESPDPELPPLGLVRGQPVRGDLRVAVSHSFAFGGNNTVLVFGRPGEEAA